MDLIAILEYVPEWPWAVAIPRPVPLLPAMTYGLSLQLFPFAPCSSMHLVPPECMRIMVLILVHLQVLVNAC